MSITLNLTEEKMKAGTSRMLAELRLAGINVDALGYNKALHVFSKALLDKPYEEVKGANFDDKKEAKPNTNSVFLFHCGSNTILAVNGGYETATNPGTDLAISYYAIGAQAQREANKLRVSVREVTLPDILEAPDTDEEWVQLANDMGYFQPHGSIFDYFDVDQIRIDGRVSDCSIDGDWRANVEAASESGENPDDEIIWNPRCEEGWDAYEYYFSFGELKRATYLGDGQWMVPYGDNHPGGKGLTVRFLQSTPLRP